MKLPPLAPLSLHTESMSYDRGRLRNLMPFVLAHTQWVPRPIDEVFDFFSHPSNLQVLTPKLLNFHITEAPEKIQTGSLIKYRLRIHGVPVRWTTEIAAWNPPHSFIDVQLSGPYKLWRHEHKFIAARGGTMLTDVVQYALPFGPLGKLVHRLFVRRDVERIFEFRSQKMIELFGTVADQPR
jgi:ligand-binding SRPBCC domain-containing protein